MQFTLPLSKGGEPLHKQIYAGLRGAVLSGKLAPEARLPSTRDLAEQLRVSRSVVLEAYEQLLAEGFVIGRRVREPMSLTGFLRVAPPGLENLPGPGCPGSDSLPPMPPPRWNCLDDLLATDTTSSSDEARATSRLSPSSNGSAS